MRVIYLKWGYFLRCYIAKKNTKAGKYSWNYGFPLIFGDFEYFNRFKWVEMKVWIEMWYKEVCGSEFHCFANNIIN